jgi:hypothetical protein
MAVADVRTRLSQIAFKVESTPGTDSIAGTPAAGDYVTCDATIRFAQDSTPNPVETGAYDDLPPIPGALRGEITVNMLMAGSGAAGTAPEWGRLLRAARMIETVTGAAVGAPTAATAGSATTATAATPFSTTAQQYRGMPVLLAGNPAAGATDVIIDYTAGRVVTLANSYSPILSTSTTLQVPVNVLYSPTSDDSAESWLTVYAWTDEIRHRLVGVKATRLAIGLTNGRPASLSMTFAGSVVDRMQNVARPAGYVPVTRQPPIWRAGLSRLNRVPARVNSASFDGGLRTAWPENPEAIQAYDPPIITGASPRWSLDPFSDSTNTPLRAGAMDAQTSIPFAAVWGTTAGNRFAISCPSAIVQDVNMSDRNSLGVDQIVLVPDLPNLGMFLACF